MRALNRLGILICGFEREILALIAREFVTPESLAQGIDILQPLLEEQGRTISDISISVTPDRKHINHESLKHFEELGAEQIILPLFANNTDKLEGKATRYLELMQ